MRNLLLFSLLLIGTTLFARNESMFREFIVLRKQIASDTIVLKEKKVLASKFLEKSLKTKDNALIGRAYYLFAIKNPDLDEKIAYLDSVIFYTENLKKDRLFPTQAYMNKGSTLYLMKDLQGTINNFILAEAAAKRSGNIRYQYDIKYNIAFLKRHIGD